MLILLLASTFALSFVPLTKNEGELAVALSAGAIDLADYKVTFTATLTGDPVTDATYKYYLFDAVTAGDKIDEVAFELTETGPDSIELLPLAEKLNGRKSFFIDVYIEEDEETPATVLTGDRLEVTFGAAATGVEAVQTSATDATITFTLDATLATDLTDTKFVGIGTAGLPVTKVGTEGHIYKVETTIAAIVAATSPYGYFKGTDGTDSTLPIWFPNKAAPVLTLTHVDTTKAKVVASELAGHDAYIKFEGETDPIKLEKVGDADITLTYAQLVKDAVVYFADKEDTPAIVSIKGLLTLERKQPTLSWAAPPTPPGDALSNEGGPDFLLKLAYTGLVAGDKVTLSKGTTVVATKVVGTDNLEFTLEEVTGDDLSILLTGTADALLSLPYEIPRAECATFVRAEVATKKLPVSFTFVAGSFAATPAGLVVYENTDPIVWTGAKYYAATWDPSTPGKASVSVDVENWDAAEKDVVAYVTDAVTTPLFAAPVKLSEEGVIFERKEIESAVVFKKLTEYELTVTPPDTYKAYIKIGEADEAELTAAKKLTLAELTTAKVYLRDVYKALASQIQELQYPELPAATWVVPATGEDKTPLLQIAFAEDSDFDGTVIKIVPEEEPEEPEAESNDTDPTVADDKVQIELTKLVGESLYLIHVDENDALLSLPFAVPAAEIEIEKKTATADRQPVEAQMGVGAVKAVPGSLVVIAEGEEDWKKAKAYALAFDGTTAGKLTGEVTLADWKDIKNKNVIAYVTDKITGDVTVKPELLSTAYTLFEKEKPKEDDDDGAFSSIVSLLAVFVSVFVALF